MKYDKELHDAMHRDALMGSWPFKTYHQGGKFVPHAVTSRLHERGRLALRMIQRTKGTSLEPVFRRIAARTVAQLATPIRF